MSTLTRWNPMAEMMTLSEAMRQLMDESMVQPRNWSLLPLDVIENEHGYVVRVAAPGLTADNFEITLHQNVLTLRARIQEPSQEGARVLVRELRYGEFTRTLQFPSQVNSENVVANLANGLLTIEVPKAEAAKTRKIAISAN